MMEMIDAATVSLLRLAGFRSRYLETSAGLLHALEIRGGGTLPPVLVMHGLSSCAADNYPLMRLLRPHVQGLIALDMPGHGRSTVPPDGLDAPAIMEASLVALDQLIEVPHLVLGNSLGGVGAIRYALARPELVAGLVLISPGGAPMSEAELAELLSLFDMRTEADGRRFMQRVLADPEAWGSSVLAWGARQRVSRRGVMALIQRIRREDLLSAEELGQLRAPALLIWGQEERILPERHCQFFEEHLPPGTRVEKPAGMGHSPMLDVPEALSERVLAFARTLG